MSDDDETPPGRPRPRRAQTATERDIEGMRARAARQAAAEASIESERARRMSRSSGSGIPIPRELDANEPTEPWDTLDRELLKPDEAKIVELSKRSGHDLITVADWAKTMALVTRKELDDRSAQRERAAQEKALLELPFRLKALEGDAKFARRAAMSTLVFLILAIGSAGIWLGIREEKLSNVIDTVKELTQRQRWTQPKDNTP